MKSAWPAFFFYCPTLNMSFPALVFLYLFLFFAHPPSFRVSNNGSLIPFLPDIAPLPHTLNNRYQSKGNEKNATLSRYPFDC